MVLLLAASALAQEIPDAVKDTLASFNADPFRPTLDPGGLLSTESAMVPAELIVHADLTQAHNPLIWMSDGGEQLAIIGNAMGLHLGAGLGLGRWRVGARTPLLRLFGSDAHKTPSTMAGDLTLSGKYAIIQGDRLRMAGLVDVSVPLGAHIFQMGDDFLTMEPRVALGGGQRIRWLANVGYRLQSRKELITANGTLDLTSPVTGCGGVAFPLSRQLALTMEGLVAFSPSALAIASTPVEGMLGLQHQHEEGRILRGGVGIGIVGGIGAPTWRLMLGVGHDPGSTPVIAPAPPQPPQPPSLAQPAK